MTEVIDGALQTPGDKNDGVPLSDYRHSIMGAPGTVVPFVRYDRQIGSALRTAGKGLVHTIHDSEMQRAGLERLASLAGLGFFRRTRELTTEQTYAAFSKLLGSADENQVRALVQAIPVGAEYVGQYGGATLRIARNAENTYVFSSK